MSAPIVFISHNRIKENRLADYKLFFQEGAELIEASKPGTVAFLAYANQDLTEVTIIHVFPDANSMTLHMQGASDRAKQAYEFMEPDTLEIYGEASEQVYHAMQQAAGPGVTIRLNPDSLGGFIRLAPD